METAQGLDAVQLPIRERYPMVGDGEVPGIDAWLTVFSSGLMLQYVNDKNARTWFPIPTLHVCAAVKGVVQVDGNTGEVTPKFVALDSEAAANTRHPPMFACIMRRTKGVKVLECHVFIAKSNQAAMALVQSSTHAYEHKEGWVDEQPQMDGQGKLQARLIPAEAAPKPDAPPEFYQKPPEHGYFYARDKNLVKQYNVFGGSKQNENQAETEQTPQQPPAQQPAQQPQQPQQPQQQPQQPPQQPKQQQVQQPQQQPQQPMMPMMPGLVPPPGGPAGLVPMMGGLTMRPGGMMPGGMMPMMPMPPPGYFADWDMFRGRPVAIMGEPGYGPYDPYTQVRAEIMLCQSN